MPLMRLDKIISDSGVASRKEAAALIKRGFVIVGGAVAVSPADKCDPETTKIIVNGKEINYKTNYYIMMNKPAGYVSATEDKSEQTVVSLLKGEYAKRDLFPTGRLDKDAEGFILLTNDGDFAHKVISPKKHIAKKYYICVDGILETGDIKAVSEGIILKDGTRCMPGTLEIIDDNCAYITIFEGKYHQVKRMMASLGKPVGYLKRISIGGLALDDALLPGEYREIADKELDNILK